MQHVFVYLFCVCYTPYSSRGDNFGNKWTHNFKVYTQVNSWLTYRIVVNILTNY